MAAQRQVKIIYITQRAPGAHGYIESFHDRLRDECLNREIFGNLREARVIIEQWHRQYNGQHAHSLLGYRTPKSPGNEQIKTSNR